MRKLLFISLILTATCLSIGCGGGGGGSEGDGGDETGQFSGSCSLKITNGESCSSGLGPVALLVLKNSSNQAYAICTGAFLTSKHILSAAHCVEGAPNSIDVVVQGKTVSTRSYYYPSGYSGISSSDLDYSVITLPSGIAGVETLPILTSKTVQRDQTINIVGFGRDEKGNGYANGVPFSKALKKGIMKVAEVELTSRGGFFLGSYDATDQSVCSGDSGGPVIMKNSDGIPGIVGVAQAVADPSAQGPNDEPRCLDGSIAIFTDVQRGSVLNDILRAAPGAGVN